MSTPPVPEDKMPVFGVWRQLDGQILLEPSGGAIYDASLAALLSNPESETRAVIRELVPEINPDLLEELADGIAAEATAAAAGATEAAGRAAIAAEQASGIANQALRASGAGQLGYTAPTPLGPKVNPYEAWPTIVKCADGSIVVCHGSGVRHDRTAQRSAVFRRSTDGGATWAAPVAITDTGRDLWPYATNVAPNGDLVSICRSVLASDNTDWKYQVIRSTDHGVTWTLEGSRVIWPFEPGVVGVPLSLISGDMIAPWSCTPGTEGNTQAYAWGMLRSVDNGATWTQEIAYETDRTEHNMLEARLWQSLDGTIVCIGRGVQQSISTDNGATWTFRATTNMIATGAPPVIVGTDEQLTCYYFDRGSFELRAHTSTLAAILTDPKAWGPARLVARSNMSGNGLDIGYAHAIQTDNGDHKIVYYSGYRAPTVQLITGSRSAGALSEARARSGVTPIATIPLNVLLSAGANITTTAQADDGGLYLGEHFILPELVDRGRVYMRIFGKVYHSSATGIVKLKLMSARGVEFMHAIPVAAASSNTYSDSGWVEVPAGFAQEATSPVARLSLLTFRASTNEGTATITAACTAYVGVKL